MVKAAPAALPVAVAPVRKVKVRVTAQVDPAVDRAVVAVVKALAVDQGGMLVAPDVIVAARRRPSAAAPSAVVLSAERNAEARTGMDHAAAPVVRPMIAPVAGLIAVPSGPIAMGRDEVAAQNAGRNFGEALTAEHQGLTHGAAARGRTALDVSPCRKTGARGW